MYVLVCMYVCMYDVCMYEQVMFHARRSLEWLRVRGSGGEQRRLVAILTLKELARSTPIFRNTYMRSFLEHVWDALRDPREEIREVAVQALGPCFIDLAKRSPDPSLNTPYFQSLYADTKKGLKVKMSNVASLHGSLLMIGELLTHCNTFMLPRFQEVTDIIVRYRHHNHVLIARQCLELLPKLAALCPQQFIDLYSRDALEHLITQTEHQSTRIQAAAFLALGETSLAMKHAMLPYSERVLATFRKGLQAPFRKIGAAHAMSLTSTRDMPTPHACLACIGMLAASLGEALCGRETQGYDGRMHELVDQMFSMGLSPTLIDALVDICRHIPSLVVMIQERLLEMLASMVSAPLADYLLRTQGSQNLHISSISSAKGGSSGSGNNSRNRGSTGGNSSSNNSNLRYHDYNHNVNSNNYYNPQGSQG